MTETSTRRLAGGCQCGAVRYALFAEPDDASICHCRMCQKALGGYFGAFANVARADHAWTRGAPATFRSSENVERGFCRDCGTPLTFRYLDRDRISVALGTLDDPAAVAPLHQHGMESRMPWFDTLHTLPGSCTEDDVPPEAMARLESRQHPDRDS